MKIKNSFWKANSKNTAEYSTAITLKLLGGNKRYLRITYSIISDIQNTTKQRETANISTNIKELSNVICNDRHYGFLSFIRQTVHIHSFKNPKAWKDSYQKASDCIHSWHLCPPLHLSATLKDPTHPNSMCVGLFPDFSTLPAVQRS